MALRSEELKRVPWFSSAEWHGVYKQIYSNDTKQQTKGYETLLVWKGRMPKLPVGVECTLSLLQVCLRDREWTTKINTGALPMYYQNDLSLMYSTTIMRFLNHISNIGPTKQTSLFQIAKQLKIPEWIVNLRHDAAHGHELPVIDLLRMASNILLSWLHDEYWKAEAQALEKSLERRNEITEIEEIDSFEDLIDLIQLWMSVGLYMDSNFSVVSDLPDEHLRNTLNDLHSLTKISKQNLDTSIPSEFDENTYRLKTARSYLMTEISNEIRRTKDAKSIGKIVIHVLINSEVFLVNSEFLELFSRQSNEKIYENLPKKMINFWQPMISLLHETKILEILTLKLVEIVNSRDWTNEKRKSAAFWLKMIGQSFLKLKISHKERQKFEHSQNTNKKTPQKFMNQKLQEIINKKNPSLKGSPWLGINSNVPRVFEEKNFTSDIILNANEWTHLFIAEFLDLISPEINSEKRKNLLDFLKIQNSEEIIITDDGDDDVHTIEDFKRICGEKEIDVTIDNDDNDNDDELKVDFADKKIRNSSWELAPENFNWADCAFGILPWQIDSLVTLGGEEVEPELIYPDVKDDIIPGIVDNRELMGKRVNWESVLRKSQRGKRKRRREADGVMNKAIEIVKTRKI